MFQKVEIPENYQRYVHMYNKSSHRERFTKNGL